MYVPVVSVDFLGLSSRERKVAWLFKCLCFSRQKGLNIVCVCEEKRHTGFCFI